MWFKNVRVFLLEEDWRLTAGALESALASHLLTPCSGLNLHSLGFVPPRADGALVESADRHLLLALGVEHKQIPRSALDEEVRQRAADHERRHGFAPGRRLLRELRERALAELAPRALARRRTVLAWIDPPARRLVVDAASSTSAEPVVSALRDALGSLPLTQPRPTAVVAEQLTGWLTAGAAPTAFSLGEEVELRGSKPGAPRARFADHPLPAPPILSLLQDGLGVVRLGLRWRERIALTLDETLRLRRLRRLETGAGNEDSGDRPDPAQRFDADFRLMVGELGQLLDDLATALDTRI